MVLKKWSIIGCVSINLFSCSSEVKEVKETNSIPDGGELYVQNCAACHGIDGTLGLSGAKDLSQTTLKDTAVQHLILNGKGAMPPFTGMLNDADIKAIVEHISTFKK